MGKPFPLSAEEKDRRFAAFLAKIYKRADKYRLYDVSSASHYPKQATRILLSSLASRLMNAFPGWECVPAFPGWEGVPTISTSASPSASGRSYFAIRCSKSFFSNSYDVFELDFVVGVREKNGATTTSFMLYSNRLGYGQEMENLSWRDLCTEFVLKAMSCRQH